MLNYVDDIFRNDIDFNDVKVENVKFVKVKYQPTVKEHLTPKLYVDTAIDEPSLVRNNKDNDFGNYNLTNINSITSNKQAENDNQVITKAYVDQFHQEKETSRRDLVQNNQDNDLKDNKLTNINSITNNNNPTANNQVANKKYIDDELDKNTVLRFKQTLQKYLKISVGNNIYNLTNYNKISITDVTEI